MYNCGESSDSNPVIASLDARRDEERGRACEEGGETDRDDGEVQDGNNQRSGIIKNQGKALLHQNGGTTEKDETILDSNNIKSEGGVCGATEQACVVAGNGEEFAVGETEAPGFLPSDGCHDNNEQQTYPSLSHSTSSYQQTNTTDVPSAGGDLGSPFPQTATLPLTRCMAETDRVQPDIDKDNEGKDEAQMPPEFDSSRLFQLVPRAHHITDETVSVMSNCTEEYLGGSSSRDTVSHERSLTSMIYDACESGGSTSDSSSSDSCGSDSGDTESNRVDHDDGIVEIQKSYLAQLPQQSGHTIPSHKREEERKEYQETEEVEKLHCIPATDIPKQSHDSVTSGGIPSEVSSQNNSVSMCDSALSVPSHPPLTYGLPLPHPSPFLFDGIAGTSSKRMPRLPHPLSDVQLHGEVQQLAVAATTVPTLEPDSLTTVFGSTPEVEVFTGDVPARSPKVPSEKVLAVTNPTSLQSCGTVEEDKQGVQSFSEDCQVKNLPGEPTIIHPITSTSTSGSQMLTGAFHNVIRTTYLNLQPLLSCKQTETPRELINTSAHVQSSGIPEVAGDTTAAGCERNVRGKAFSSTEKSDSPHEDSEERDDCDVGMNNKSNFKLPVGKGGATVELSGQLAKDFDQLQAFERLPNATKDSGGLEKTKTSMSTTCSETGVPLSRQAQLANRLPTLVSQEQSYSAAAADVGTMAESPGSTTSPSSAQLASLLLSQLETDLNAT